jgi:outer membrane protein TolC
VDFVAGAVVGNTGSNPVSVDYRDGNYNAGLAIGLPLDRYNERNAYRQSLITLESAKRSAAQLADTIRQAVRNDWRTLQQAKGSYEIQLNSLALAQRRVDSVALLLQAGRAGTRTQDLLSAQSDLITAQNAVIAALINHTSARLQLWRDMETLEVTPNGVLEEQIPNESVTP